MNVPRMARLGPLLGLLVLLLVACGKDATVTGSNSTAPNSTAPTSDLTASPRAEGTGLESPQPRANGGVSVSVAPLPIGDGSIVGTNNNGNDECINVAWLGQLPPGVVLKVTSVEVVDGPFTAVDVATAGCPGSASPACVGFQLRAANNGTGSCSAGVEWTGTPATEGSLKLVGELSCPQADSAKCQHIGVDVQNSAQGQSPISFDFEVPPSPDQQQPTTGSQEPATGSQEPTATSSQEPTATSSP